MELLTTVASRPFDACEAEWKEVLGGLRLGRSKEQRFLSLSKMSEVIGHCY